MLFIIEKLELEGKEERNYFFNWENCKFYVEPSTRYYDLDNHNFKR